MGHDPPPPGQQCTNDRRLPPAPGTHPRPRPSCPRPPSPGPTTPGAHPWERPWNSRAEAILAGPHTPGRAFWATDVGGHEQVGCVYTAQGMEYEWTAPSFSARTSPGRQNGWQARPEKSRYHALEGLSPQRYLTYALNTYRVLATLGRWGTRLYSKDPATQQRLRHLLARRPLLKHAKHASTSCRDGQRSALYDEWPEGVGSEPTTSVARQLDGDGDGATDPRDGGVEAPPKAYTARRSDLRLCHDFQALNRRSAPVLIRQHRACLVLQGLSGEILEKILEFFSRSRPTGGPSATHPAQPLATRDSSPGARPTLPPTSR